MIRLLSSPWGWEWDSEERYVDVSWIGRLVCPSERGITGWPLRNLRLLPRPSVQLDPAWDGSTIPPLKDTHIWDWGFKLLAYGRRTAHSYAFLAMYLPSPLDTQ